MLRTHDSDIASGSYLEQVGTSVSSEYVEVLSTLVAV
ncbi:hypothetical protein TSOC111612_01425 [Tsukamurella ocularis]